MDDVGLRWLRELKPAEHARAGGKAASLARMLRAGLPVPDGFVLLPGVFDGDALRADARAAAEAACQRLLSRAGAVAVRSSAGAEDSDQASFAGELETVLGVEDVAGLHRALTVVRASARGERVQAYERARGLSTEGGLAVLVQGMLSPSLAGVLFTADPVTSDLGTMVGSFVEGLGERLVSGEETGEAFSLDSMRGNYAGPEALRPHARKLYRLARRAQRLMGQTLDLEWAIAGGRPWLLQSRPITTMVGRNRRTGEVNDSHRGRYLWTSTNTGEAVPDVMTPLTWSVAEQALPPFFPLRLPGDPVFLSNIGGRLYANLSLQVGLLTSLLGISVEEALEHSSETLGRVPQGVTVHSLVLPRGARLTRMLPAGLVLLGRRIRDGVGLDARIERTRAQTEASIDRIAAADAAGVREMWEHEYGPVGRAWFSTLITVTGNFTEATPKLRKTLSEVLGEEDANTLLSGFGGSAGQLASLELLRGIARVARGELSREELLRAHGHRGENEAELSLPRPREDPGWLDAEIERYRASGVDPEALLAERAARVEAILLRLEREDRGRGRRVRRQVERVARLSAIRERVRNEQTRMIFALRCMALRAGELLDLGDDVFFLQLDEVLDTLGGQPRGLDCIAERKRTHARYQEWSPYPAFIAGRFDPEAWAKDPGRRLDFYDADASPAPASEHVRGFPGAAGVVEGRVRVMGSASEAGAFVDGEVLVTHTTNVGWTPLFVRAGAVVTDVGAPLSHAAIVARELGVPAVVGTTNATRILRTGMMVRVDGGRGTVEILQ